MNGTTNVMRTFKKDYSKITERRTFELMYSTDPYKDMVDSLIYMINLYELGDREEIDEFQYMVMEDMVLNSNYFEGYIVKLQLYIFKYHIKLFEKEVIHNFFFDYLPNYGFEIHKLEKPKHLVGKYIKFKE